MNPPEQNDQTVDMAEKRIELARDQGEIKYLLLLWNRRYLIALVVFVFIGLGLLQVNRAVPVYTSTALVKFEPAASQVVDFGERSSIIYQRDEIRTAVQLIRSTAIAQAVLDSRPEGQVSTQRPDYSPLANIRSSITQFLRSIRSQIVSYDPPEEDNELLAEQSRARRLLNDVSVYQRPDTRLIEIRVSRQNREEAKELCDEFALQFKRSIHQDKRETFSYSRDYINRQIEDTRHRLEEAEREFQKMSGQADMRVIQESRNLTLDNFVALSQEAERLQKQIIDLEARNENAKEVAELQLTSGNTTALSGLIARRDELEARRASLAIDFRDESREVQEIEKQIESVNQQIEERRNAFVAAQVKDLEIQLNSARTKLAKVKERLDTQEKELQAIDAKIVQLTPLQRDVETKRDVYNTLLEKSNQLEVLDEVTPNNVTIVEEASIPTVPTSPNVTRTLSMFIFFGLATGSLLVFFLHWIDRSVKTPDLVEAKLGLPSLAILPYLRATSSLQFGRKRGQRRVLAIGDEKYRQGAEAFRYLRTSINYSMTDRKNQVILVTSALPQEGKSTVAANLAAYYAEQGEKTLLMDCDLKRPALHTIFEGARAPGVTDLVTGQARFDQAIITTHIEGLYLLPAGAMAPSPVSLLESRSMGDLMAKLREDYSVIIVDSSPAEGMADALVLSTRTDSVALVVKQGSTPLEALARVTQKMSSIGANVIGAIYNNTRPSRSAEHYGYQSYYYAQKET